MATHTIPALPTPEASQQDRPLTREEWWDLFDQLRLAQQAGYTEHGGPVAFFRKEHEADIA